MKTKLIFYRINNSPLAKVAIAPTLLATIVLGALTLSSLPVAASEVINRPYIVTSGAASIEVPPDIARIKLRVSALENNVSMNANAADIAMKKVNNSVTGIITALKQLGLNDNDINAANFYSYIKNSTDGPVATPEQYIAIRNVEVTLPQELLRKLNEVLAAVIKYEGTEVYQVTYDIARPKIHRENVRNQAFQDAIQRANAVAKAFGVKLCKIREVTYHAPFQAMTMSYSMRKVASQSEKDNSAAGYNPKKIQLEDRVDVTYFADTKCPLNN